MVHRCVYLLVPVFVFLCRFVDLFKVSSVVTQAVYLVLHAYCIDGSISFSIDAVGWI